MKKLLALVLALALALPLGVTAFAADAEKVDLSIPDLDAGVLYDGDGNRYDPEDLIPPDSTVYLPFRIFAGENPDDPDEVGAWYGDRDNYKVKFDKGDNNAKMIKKISFVEKKFEARGWRCHALKIELAQDFSGDEFKLTPSVTFTAKRYLVDSISAEDGEPGNGVKGHYGFDTLEELNGASEGDVAFKDLAQGVYAPGSKMTMGVKFFMGNGERSADADFKAGDGGVVVKPQKNEDNEITWEDEKDTLAWLNFTSDDDAKKFFPKMTTKWDDQEYAEYFADQDAYLFDFIGNPKIASTSRASLRLRIPFLNEDGELSVDEDSIVVYQVVDGALVDITGKGRIHETDDGDWVFELKTRELGTYIIAEKPAAAGEAAEAPAEAESPAEAAEEAPAEEAPAAPAKAILPSFAK